MANRRLYQLLFPFLLIWYAFVVAGLVAAVATFPDRPIGSLDEIPWWSHAIAFAVVAATWAPVSAYLDRGVHQLAFGQRDNAYEVAGHVSRQLLPSVAAALAGTMALPYVEIESDGRVVTSYGKVPEGASMVEIALTYQDERLGTLRVSARRRRDRLSAADVRLLDDLGRQVAMTLYAARSREQLVAAREEERLRIRRDLHDGLGPTLASLGLRLGVLQRTVRADPAAAAELAGELRGDVRQATADIRRLVYELRPPLLDEFGLVDALRNLRSGDTLSRTVSAPEPMPALPAAVEVALYRIAAEALHNAARHASATECAVNLAVTASAVTLTVTDNGCGLPADYLAGVGHRSMRERSSELGGVLAIGPAPAGGTCVAVTFALGARDPAAEARDVAAGARVPAAGARESAAGPRVPAVRPRDPAAEVHVPAAGVCESAAGLRDPAVRPRVPAAGPRDCAAEVHDPAAGARDRAGGAHDTAGGGAHA